jgi:hypothetical protein
MEASRWKVPTMQTHTQALAICPRKEGSLVSWCMQNTLLQALGSKEGQQLRKVVSWTNEWHNSCKASTKPGMCPVCEGKLLLHTAFSEPFSHPLLQWECWSLSAAARTHDFRFLTLHNLNIVTWNPVKTWNVLGWHPTSSLKRHWFVLF